MGECIIARSGAGSSSSNIMLTNLPVLNENYPIDNYFKYGSNITLSCMVDMYHTNCTYQWYVDDTPIDGATNDTYIFNGTDKYYNHKIFCKVTNDIGSVYSRTANITVYPSVFKIMESNNCYIEFDSNLYVNGSSMSINGSKNSVSKTKIPFEFYNSMEISVYGTTINSTIYIGNVAFTRLSSSTATTLNKTFTISDFIDYTTLKISNDATNNYVLVINYIRLK